MGELEGPDKCKGQEYRGVGGGWYGCHFPAIFRLPHLLHSLQLTNFSMHNYLKTPYFQCRWPKSNPPPSLPPHGINHPSIPNSSCLLAFLFISVSVYLTPLFLCRPSFSLFPSHTHTQNTLFLSYPFCPPPLSWVLEDLSKLRGRKSTFLPHQPAKPGVEKEQLKAPLLLMLTANANAPFAKHEGQWAQAKG